MKSIRKKAGYKHLAHKAAKREGREWLSITSKRAKLQKEKADGRM